MKSYSFVQTPYPIIRVIPYKNIISIIKKLRDKNYGKYKITIYLNNNGYKNYYGNVFTTSGVQYILENYIT